MNQFFKQKFPLELKPAQAWFAIIALLSLSVLCILAGSIARALNFIFPIGSLAVGILLYIRYPILYIGFTWWLWFLTPIVRRLVDYRSSFTDPSPLLLAPYLVTLISLLSFLRHLPQWYKQGSLPFILAFVSVLYGFLIGVIKNPPVDAFRDLLDWLAPIALGFFLYINWKDYPNYRENIKRTFVWGVLLTGVYGVFQYLVAPEWDRAWLINLQEKSITFGQPEPLQLRVWSTMQGPGVFASALIPGLLMLFTSGGALRVPASIAGYLAFLLSLVRTGWGSWFIGLLTVNFFLRSRAKIRLVLNILAIGALCWPLTTVEPFSNVINSRFQTLLDLNSDTSGQVRTQMYQDFFSDSSSNILGSGIGAISEFDSGILHIFLTLGWVAGSMYLAGILLPLFKLFKRSKSHSDVFAVTAVATSVSACFQLIFGSGMLGLPGVILWGFLGLSLAAQNYYQQQPLAIRDQFTAPLNVR